MVKSPVEGSTTALIRLETPVVFSDFIRPICLPDILDMKNIAAAQVNGSTESHERESADALSRSKKDEKYENALPENREYFMGPADLALKQEDDIEDEFVRRVRAIPVDYTPAPTPSTTIATVTAQPPRTAANGTTTNGARNMAADESSMAANQWTMCNTLGWSRQRDHLQRVQLKLSHMAQCENISIATVNSMCTEAAFQKQDCTEEEYAGSPVMCQLPNSNRWALVGVARYVRYFHQYQNIYQKYLIQMVSIFFVPLQLAHCLPAQWNRTATNVRSYFTEFSMDSTHHKCNVIKAYKTVMFVCKYELNFPRFSWLYCTISKELHFRLLNLDQKKIETHIQIFLKHCSNFCDTMIGLFLTP